MAPVTTDSIILQSFTYSETSKILRLLTRTHGVRSAIARGALRPRSRYGGLLEPFSVGEATLYLKEGRGLQTLSAFDLERTGQPLGRDLLRFGAASVLAEIVLKTASEAADPMLFEHVDSALERISDADSETLEPIALAETWKLVSELGFAPELDGCLSCGSLLGPDEDATFDYAEGGVRCKACGGAVRGKRLPSHARHALLSLREGKPPHLERTTPHWTLLARFLAYHVTDGRPLRSLEFLTDAILHEPCAG